MPDPLSIFHNPVLQAVGQIGGLIFIRLLPVFLLTPLFGGDTMPNRLRVGLTVIFTLALLAPLLPAARGVIPWLDYFALTVKEALIGLTLAVFLLVLFEAITSFGALVDLARGATIANVFDPITHAQESILAAFFTQLSLALFFSLGGHRILFSAFGDSFVLLRPFELLPRAAAGAGAAEPMIQITGELFLIALRLAAPAVMILFLMDFALGLINRVAPQIQVFFLSMTMKGSIGLLVILAGLGFLIDLLTRHFADLLKAIENWVLTTAP